MEPQTVTRWSLGGIPYGGATQPAGLLRLRGPGAATHISLALHAALEQGLAVCLRCLSAQQAALLTAGLAKPPRFPAAALLRAAATEDSGVFGPYGFAETVGLWLKNGLSPAAALLNPFISTDSFEFTPAEFLELKERLLQTLRKYEKLPRVSKGLEDLNTGFFRHRSLTESQQFITQHVEQYLAEGSALYRDFLLAIHGHARAALFAGQRNLRSRRDTLTAFTDRLAEIPAANARQQRKSLPQLREDWAAYHLLHYGTPPATESTAGPEALAKAFAAEASALTQAREQLGRELQANSLSLNAVTVDPSLGDPEVFRRLADRLTELLSKMDEAGLYQLPIGGNNAATAPRQLQLLENTLEKLRNTQRHLGELPDFYARRHFWYAQPARLRRLMAPLLDLPADDWEIAFTSWYFERCLQRVEVPGAHRLDPAALARLADELLTTARNGRAGADASALRIVLPGQPVPPPTGAADVLIDLTDEAADPAWKKNTVYQLAPLQDATARYLTLAGCLAPALALTQPFATLRPPEWTAVYVAEAPPRTGAGAGFQLGEGPWKTLPQWPGASAGHLRLFFPDQLSADDGATVLRHWEDWLLCAPRLSIFHRWPSDRITQALLSDGFGADFLVAALIRSAEAAAAVPFDRETLLAMGREVRTRCGLQDPGPHPLAEHLVPLLQDRLPQHFFEVHVPWRDTFLPLLVMAPDGKKTVLLPDGRLPGQAPAEVEALRQRELSTVGLRCLAIDAEGIWGASAGATEALRQSLR
ncbi:hypothetical protein QWY85_02110 [Neolewinella lacunae]|uniref:Uncharacterized protein n=1 Tax=Neolewinella lacunae TaxID=1517758 RepID=A0A923TAN6_9BACT|nr:hypothetical protein [Neolewinella lacunae]MBC6996701.1 hypothetical protein [Neolewinella lacunae]MDN3633434.1 hypothetical protein [Neolewinella lacunae]